MWIFNSRKLFEFLTVHKYLNFFYESCKKETKYCVVTKIPNKIVLRLHNLHSYYAQNLYLFFVISIILSSLVSSLWFDVYVVHKKIHHQKSEMINFVYSLGFMDYAAFVVIVAIYFILTIYLNTRVNSNVNKNQSGSNSEWNVKEKDENFFSGGLCLHFLMHPSSRRED